MIFTPTEITGAFVIDIEQIVDNRGFFTRCYCRDQFAQRGLITEWPQTNIAWSEKKGTVRGLHYVAIQEEAKVVRCTRGAAYVVTVDIRPDSSSYGRWIAVELNEDNHRSMYVPPYCAQGYQTLAEGTEMLYQMSSEYIGNSTCGIRFDDPWLQITWPRVVASISEADRSWPPYRIDRPITIPPKSLISS